VLAAVAAGWALGLSQEVLTTGIKTFGLELPTRPPCCRSAPRSRRVPATRK
jgi:hypothetical protein